MYGVGVPETLVEVGGSDAGKRLGGICSKWLGRGETPGQDYKSQVGGRVL